MKLVIDIPNFIYQQILKKHISKGTIAKIFENGTPLEDVCTKCNLTTEEMKKYEATDSD